MVKVKAIVATRERCDPGPLVLFTGSKILLNKMNESYFYGPLRFSVWNSEFRFQRIHSERKKNHSQTPVITHTILLLFEASILLSAKPHILQQCPTVVLSNYKIKKTTYLLFIGILVLELVMWFFFLIVHGTSWFLNTFHNLLGLHVRISCVNI